MKQLIVGDALHEFNVTRRILERLPEEHMAWQPHSKSMTLGGLATHLINLLTHSDRNGPCATATMLSNVNRGRLRFAPSA